MTTNYYDAFVEVAEDCPIATSAIPPQKDSNKTIATMEYEMLVDSPYKYTSDDVLFIVYAQRNSIADTKQARDAFFAKGQPCFRSSPLTKRYGWGVHSDSEGNIALYGVESDEYKSFVGDTTIKHLKAMRSSRA